MKQKIFAIIMSLCMIISMLPVMANNTDVKAASFSIVNPTVNELVAAGDINIDWTDATGGAVKEYSVYINDQKIDTTTESEYEWYSTTVQMNTVYVVAEYTNGMTEQSDSIKFGVSKKGLGLSTDMGANLDLNAMGVAWYYNWGENPSSGSQYQGIEYVPMVWRETDANNLKNRVNSAINKGYKYILTYNEPDLAGQCNMTVDAVYNAWQGLDDVDGINISSPVTAIWPQASSNWFQTFMSKIDVDNDYDPDFISIHCYPENYAGAAMAEWFLEEVVDWTWNTYHKPIWITEFSTTGDSVTATGENGTKEFWEAVMPELDKREYVERYAAFGFNSDAKGLWKYSTGELTPAGEIYKNYGNPKDPNIDDTEETTTEEVITDETTVEATSAEEVTTEETTAEETSTEEVTTEETTIEETSTEEITDDAPTSGTCGDDITWIFNEDTGVLEITGEGDMYDYIEYDGEYGDIYWSPWENNEVRKVNISYGVTSIGEGAFYECWELTSITIPDSVANIGDRAFSNCINLKEVILPDNNVILGNDVFAGCENLTDLYVYNNKTSLLNAGISNDITIHCYYDSAAYWFAKQNGNDIKLISEETEHITTKQESTTIEQSTTKKQVTTTTKQNITIKPAKVKFSLKSGKKKVSVKWNKVKGASGYTIYYKTSKKGSWKKLKTVSSKKTSYLKKKLKSGRTYYFTVKAYKKVNGKMVYGNFITKKVKVK